ncbi:MAG: NAD-dependent epimerase/dehydratase family protein [Owenweeksia sp.]
MKRVLIFGETTFTGGLVLNKLLKSEEYEITFFSPEKEPEVRPGVNFIKGRRDTTHELEPIAAVPWDYVIDLSAGHPHQLENTLRVISPPSRYILQSSCSVYSAESRNMLLRKEEANIREFTTENDMDNSRSSLGARKAECERLLIQSGIDHIILRPAMVYGPGDPDDLLYYWLYRIREGGLLIIPDQGERFFSCTYVKDLARTIVACLDSNSKDRIYNVISTPMLNIRKIIDAVSPILNRHCVMLNAPPAFLHTHNIKQWTDMPLWVDGDHWTFDANLWQENFNMKPTDFSEGLLETLGYYASLHWPPPMSGLSTQQYRELLARLRNFMAHAP